MNHDKGTVLSATKEWENGGQAESTEWFTEGHAFSRSYALLLAHPLPSISSTDDTQEDWERETSCERERRGGGRGPEESLVRYKSFNTLWGQDIISRYSSDQHFLLPAKNLAYWTRLILHFLLIFSRHHSSIIKELVLTCGQNWHTDKIFFLLSFTKRSEFITEWPRTAFKTDTWNEFWVNTL